MNFEFSTKLFELKDTGTITESLVEHAGFEEFCFRLQDLVRATSEFEDDSFEQPLRKLRHYRFDQCAGPVGFGNDQVMPNDKLKGIEEELMRCALSYNSIAGNVSETINCLKNLVLKNHNPLLEEIQSHVDENRRTAILLKETRHISMLSKLLEGDSLADWVQIVSQPQLSKITNTFDLILCVGRSNWFKEFVFRSPRARETRVIRFSWLTDADCRRLPVFEGWQELSGKLERLNKVRPKNEPIAIGMASVRSRWDRKLADEDLIPRFDLAVIAKQFVGNQNDESNAQETVAARLVELEGRRGTFIEADSRSVLVIDLNENTDRNVERVSCSSLSSGMFLLLRGDSDPDTEYIIPIADKLLGRRAETLRRFQKAWKSRLKDVLFKEGFGNTVELLKQEGSTKATEINLRNWLGQRNIRTDDPEDFYAIMRVCGLGGDEARCWQFAKQIDSAHKRAGALIRKELLRQVRGADLNELEQLGEMRFELEGIGGRPMLAVRIVRVSDFTSDIVPHHMNRIFELEEDLNG